MTVALGRTAARSLLTSGVLAVWLVGVLAMWRGWRARARRTVVPPLPSVPPSAGTDLAAPLVGVYLGTTIEGHWLDRVTSRQLGERSSAHLRALPGGVAVGRHGYDDMFIAKTELVGVRLDRAHAGKVVAGNGLLVVSWRHGGRVLETGFRANDPHDQQALADVISGMIREAASPASEATREFS